MTDTEKPTIQEIERGQTPLDADELLLQSLGYKQVNKTSVPPASIHIPLGPPSIHFRLFQFRHCLFMLFGSVRPDTHVGGRHDRRGLDGRHLGLGDHRPADDDGRLVARRNLQCVSDHGRFVLLGVASGHLALGALGLLGDGLV